MKKLNWSGYLAALSALYFLSGTIAMAEENVSRVWIKYHSGQAENAHNALNQAGAKIHFKFSNLNAIAATLPTVALEILSKIPGIEFIEEDAKRYPSAQTVPYGINMVQAPSVWDADNNGEVDIEAPVGAGVKVCIIDSGLYSAHEDIPQTDVTGVNTTAGNWNQDGCGHGTHVAGTIDAVNNTIGVVGISPGKIPLHIVRVFGDSCSWAYSSDLVSAADACKAAGAKVISMSLGGGTPSTTEQTAFQNLWNQGILSVAAAGNGGNSAKSYPASYSSVISVAAVDSSKARASFSQYNAEVDLAAPGVGVLSTIPWNSPTLKVGTDSYLASSIENSAATQASGALVNGGLCGTTGDWSGQVVLCQRGTYSFYDKVSNVQNSGGTAAIIYNNVSGNFTGTLGNGNSSTIPAISLSKEDGEAVLASSLGQAATVNNTVIQPGSGYEAWDGTSMATPHVSGIAALIWSADTSRTNSQVRAALENTALDLGVSGRDDSFGYGLVQAAGALQYLTNNSTPTPPSPPTNLSAIANSKSQVTLAWTNTSSNETGFKIERCKGSTCTNFTQIATVPSGSQQYVNTGLVKRTTYRYRIRAYNSSGDSVYAGPVSVTTKSR